MRPAVDDDTLARSPSMRWLGLGAAAVVVGVFVVFAALLLLRDDGKEAPTPLAPRLTRSLSLLDLPQAGAREVLALEEGAALTVIGRSPDGHWLAVELVRSDIDGWAPAYGWAPADAIANAPESRVLPVIGGAESATPAVTPIQTPDYPDLAVADVISRQNQLVVFVTNDGAADVNGEILVAVGDGPPHRIDVGKPLRPGELLESVLPGEYVQRPATVSITVTGGDGVNEVELGNNRFETVVQPDLANDLEINAAAVDPVTQVLNVTLRNNSPIPVLGYATLAVRQLPPESLLLGRIEAPFNLAPGAMLTVPFEVAAAIDMTRSQVLLSTDALVDADSTNDVFPR